MYLLPSMSTSVAPDARLMKTGEPPTDVKARTGLSTPPGSSCCARANSFFDLSDRIGKRQRYQKTLPGPQPPAPSLQPLVSSLQSPVSSLQSPVLRQNRRGGRKFRKNHGCKQIRTATVSSR